MKQTFQPRPSGLDKNHQKAREQAQQAEKADAQTMPDKPANDQKGGK